MSVSGVSFLSGAAPASDNGPAAPAPTDERAAFADAMAGARKSTASPVQAKVRREDAKAHEKALKADHDRDDDNHAKPVKADQDQSSQAAAAQSAGTTPATRDARNAKSEKAKDEVVRNAAGEAARAPVAATGPAPTAAELVDATLAAPVLAALAEAAAAGQGGKAIAPATASPDPVPAATSQPTSQADAAAPLPTTAAMMAARAVMTQAVQPKDPGEAKPSRKARDTATAEQGASIDSIATAAPAQTADASQPDIASPILPDATRQLADGSADRQLDLVKQGAWLDGLSRDIAATGDSSSTLRFQVAPQHLGVVQVELTRGAGGAAVALTASSESARAILADARPQLVAEAKAQGIHIASAQVDVGTDSRQSDSSTRSDHRHEPRSHASLSSQASDGGANNGRSQTRSQPIAVNQSEDGRADAPAGEMEPPSAAAPADGMYA